MKKNILYVEDNMSNLLLIKRIVEQNGNGNVTMLEASNAERGLEIAIDKKPDLILIDIVLPKMNGYQLLARLKENVCTRNIPTIAISANAMASDLKKGQMAGFNGYLTKPINVKEFKKIIAVYLSDIKEASL